MGRLSAPIAKAFIYNLGSARETPVPSTFFSSHFMNLVPFFPLIILHMLLLPPKANRHFALIE